jgi:hypothetical protein
VHQVAVAWDRLDWDAERLEDRRVRRRRRRDGDRIDVVEVVDETDLDAACLSGTDRIGDLVADLAG